MSEKFAAVVAKYGPTMKALQDIRDKRLYIETHKTFESYVKEKFGEDLLVLLAEWEKVLSQHN
jgi:hypothetical protein